MSKLNNYDKKKIALFAFLAFCVLSSKNLIIYNEETLVSLSFLAFIYFVFQYLSSTIRDSLNERSDTIKIELQNFLNFKKESLEQLLKEHKKVKNLSYFLRNLARFSQGEVVSTAGSIKGGVQSLFFRQTEQRLSTLALSGLPLQEKLQQLRADNLLFSVVMKSRGVTKKVITPSEKSKYINSLFPKVA